MQQTKNLILSRYPSCRKRAHGLLTICAFVFLPLASAQNPQIISLQQQIDIIKAKYKNAKPTAPATHEANPTYRQLYNVPIGSKYGYMDASGKIVIAATFEYAGDFSEGLALVQLPASGTKMDRGFIDQTGKLQFRANFPSNDQYNASHIMPTVVSPFHEGMASVEILDSRIVRFSGYLDRRGHLAIAADFQDAKSFSEGVAAVTIASPNDFLHLAAGFIYPNGQFAIEPKFEDTHSYTEDVAGVKDPATHKWGYIDHSGSYVIQPKYDKVWEFSQGLALVELSGGRIFINKSGAVVAGPFVTAYPFSEGSAAVNIGGRLGDWGDRADFVIGGKWGYIGLDGKFKIPANYDWALPFSEGFAAVNVGGDSTGGAISGGKWGFVDVHGSYLVRPIYDAAGRFKGGLANVEGGGTSSTGNMSVEQSGWHYIDKGGKTVQPKE